MKKQTFVNYTPFDYEFMEQFISSLGDRFLFSKTVGKKQNVTVVFYN